MPDLIVIEACSSMTNLLDKRSRFAPSTQSLMAVCPVDWLVGPREQAAVARWLLTGVIRTFPSQRLVLPVRDIRVVYALQRRHYEGFQTHQVPHAHEFFVPMDSLVAEHSDQDPAMQALFARASAASNFLAAL